MSNRFRDKYRLTSTRLKSWDYASNAIYFITINTHRHEEFFGEIKNEKMLLSNLGTIADLLWHEIKNHFDIVELDAFVVMPNHVHGILTINNPEKRKSKVEESAIETRHALSLPSKTTIGINRFQNQGKDSLSSIVGSYKSAVSKHAHRLGFRFGWQDRFYDRIIRDETSLLKAQKYIDNNVLNWEKDPLRKGSGK